MSRTRSGGCHCGSVRYTTTGPLRPVVACHCKQCRRMSGHYFAATQSRRENFDLQDNGGLRWYQTSPGVQRGFCGICGSSLFFQRESSDLISIAAGTLDEPTGLELVQHIFVGVAGDYYRITDDLPQADAYGDGMPGVDDDPLY